MSRQKGYKITEETRVKLSKAHSGKKLSAEHKAKISALKTGVKLSDKHRKNISLGHMGIKCSEEEKATKRLVMPHRQALYCPRVDLFFSSIKQASLWLVGSFNARPNISKAIKNEKAYRGFRFEKVDKENVKEGQYGKEEEYGKGYLN